MADLNAWLAGLAPGQPVAIYTSWTIEAHVDLATVARVTPTRVSVEGVHFWRTTLRAGQQVGGQSEIRPLDDPSVVLARQQRLFRDVNVEVDRLFKQVRDQGLTSERMLDALFAVRGEVTRAMGDFATLVTDPAALGAAEAHDDTTGEESGGGRSAG